MKTLRHYKALGFDETIRVSKGLYRPRCSACSALVVNNVAIHERGCLNERRGCKGCSNLVGRFQTYCKDCS